MSLTFIVYAVFIAVVATHSILEMLTASVVILLDLGALVVWTSNINYVSDVLCRARRSRPLPKADPGYQPFVSLHIPAYNEPLDVSPMDGARSLLPLSLIIILRSFSAPPGSAGLIT